MLTPYNKNPRRPYQPPIAKVGAWVAGIFR